jgi:hypothetical protein
LDKLILEFEIRKEDAQRLMDVYSFDSHVESWVSSKLSVCRYNYRFLLKDGNSFYIGFCPNWKKEIPHIDAGRIEFNPSKVCFDLEFISVYKQLLSLIPKSLLKPVRFDLAIDLPVARDKVYLLKDRRLYEEYCYSMLNRTQYLGVRNSHGRVKVYNKALEQKLDIDLTRIEITIDYDKSTYGQVKMILPSLYILDSYQFSVDITGTDKVILIAVMSDMSLLNELGRKKKEKIKSYLKYAKFDLTLDYDKYSNVLKQIQELIELDVMI